MSFKEPSETSRSTQIPAELLDDVLQGDCREVLTQLPDASVHAIVSDIPYGIGAEDWDVLHDNSNSAYRGSSPAQIEAGSVFKARGKPLNGWSEADRQIPQQYYEWCSTWAPQWLRVLKPGGSVLIFAGRRLAHRAVGALEDTGFTLKDSLAWLRPRAPHRAQRLSAVYERRGDLAAATQWESWRVGNLRPTFEPIQWLVKPYKIGTTIADNVLRHGVGAYNQAAFEQFSSGPENVLAIGFEPGETGAHPTQKPVRLMEALVALVTKPDQVVLDPFAGSGSTLVAAQRSDRRFIGVEQDVRYCDTAKRRLNEVAFEPTLSLNASR